MKTKSAASKAATPTPAPKVETSAPIVLAYSIPKRLWGLADFSDQLVVLSCPYCEGQHLYKAREGRQVERCRRELKPYILGKAGDVPAPRRSWFRPDSY